MNDKHYSMNPSSFPRPSRLLPSLFAALAGLLLPGTAPASVPLSPEVAAAIGMPRVQEGLREGLSCFFLTLGEPVVDYSVVENGSLADGADAAAAADLTPADLGLDILEVSGTPAPRLRWVDQNRLRIAFAPGSSAKTLYTLRFKPGTTYLGGAPLPKKAYSLRRPPVSLHTEFLPARAGGAALLHAADKSSLEACQLPQQHEGLRVRFRRLRELPLIGEWVPAEAVEAELRPATVGDGLTNECLGVLLEEHGPKGITATTPLPRTLLALPTRPLEPGASYRIEVEASADSGFLNHEGRPFTTPRAQDCKLLHADPPASRPLPPGRSRPEKAGGAPTALQLCFEQPVREEELRALWGKLGVSFNGQAATLGEDGSYHALVEGQDVRLRLAGMQPCITGAGRYRKGGFYRYNAYEGCALGLRLELESTRPLELGLSLPQGITPAKDVHLAVLPDCPAMTGNGSNLVPRSGPHCLRLPCVNTGRVTATAYRWEADDAARLLPLLRANMRDESTLRDAERRLAWLHRRAQALPTAHWAGLEERRNLATALKALRREARGTEPLRARALARATAYPAMELEIRGQEGGTPLCTRGDVLLDLDRLTGGQAKPGLYLVSLRTEGTPAVQAALDAFAPGVEPSCTVDYLVQVTDMSPRLGYGRLLLRSLTTGEPLDGVRITPYSRLMESDDERGSREAEPMESPAAFTLDRGDAELPNGLDRSLLLLQRGEDYSLLLCGEGEIGGIAPPRGSAAPLPVVVLDNEPVGEIELFCDRPLYRPGETVHVRGVLRLNKDGELSTPKAGQEVALTLARPNGEEIEFHKVEADAYGAFAADFRLPEGEEDVTGAYACIATTEDGVYPVAEIELPCEVFRRDAFEAELKADIAPVAPGSFRITLTAKDYNGSPLAGGRADFILDSDVPLQHVEGCPKDALADDGQFAQCRLALDARGQAVLSGSFKPFTEAGELSIEASVANEREEHIRLAPKDIALLPADFRIDIPGDREGRLFLRDALSGQVLGRAQELQLSLGAREDKVEQLGQGISRTTRVPRLLHECRLGVPAACEEGILLRELFKGLGSIPSDAQLDISGRDAEGHELRFSIAYRDCVRDPDDPESFYGDEEGTDKLLHVEGRELVYHPDSAEGGALQAYISSQGRLRYELMPFKAGTKEVRIPLAPNEYGEVNATIVSCTRDAWGHYTCWQYEQAEDELEHAEKKLSVSFTLPQGARPGQLCRVGGRVTDAAGKPVRAAVTLFAVDAGMLSIAPYRLPELLKEFYRGNAGSFSLKGSGTPASGGPPCCMLPDYRAAQESPWPDAPEAARRSLCPPSFCSNPMWYDTRRLSQRKLDQVLWRTRKERLLPFPGSSKEQEVLYLAGNISGHSGMLTMDSINRASGVEALWESAPTAQPCVAPPSPCVDDEECEEDGYSDEGGAAPPRRRHHFVPTALWVASLETAEDGSFCSEVRLPDTLTTYRVFAVALGADGQSFGQGEGDFLVNQPLMLTAGTPFFMSLGDTVHLPLTITNNSGKAGSWTVALEGAGAPQQVQLAAQESRTLFFEVAAQEEGERILCWTATGGAEGDSVEARFPVHFPAPLLKEQHRLALGAGETLDTAGLLADGLAGSTRGSLALEYASSPLLHFSGTLDYLLEYPYGCTEQTASALLPWLYHGKLAPFCPPMAKASPAKVKETVEKAIQTLLARQQEDGGLAYWGSTAGEQHPSSPWASAYAALVLTIAGEQGYKLPGEAMDKLADYLDGQLWKEHSPFIRYAAARALGDEEAVARVLADALREAEENRPHPWLDPRGDLADLRFMAGIHRDPAGRHQALLAWMRVQGRDYRHPSTWSSGWQLIALGEYLRLDGQAGQAASLRVDGGLKAVQDAPARLEWKATAGRPLAATAPKLAAEGGTVYVSLKAKAQPAQTEYPGVTEKGLQVTRVYETRGADGIWRPSTQWQVGDIVRVTLTCAKVADELRYLVLEDRLPSTLESINPRVPGQAAGLEDGGLGEWSPFIDHKEYLADRVRAFSTRWWGRGLINMRYYARVKRAGSAMAPPAQAQLMYEPQCYGLSPNTKVESIQERMKN